MWLRYQETPKAQHEEIQRNKLSAWYITYKIQGPVAQPEPILGVVPANPEQLKSNRIHFQGKEDTFCVESAHVIGREKWTIQHVPEGVDGPTLARALLEWTQQGWAVIPRRTLPETSKSMSHGNVVGGSGRSAKKNMARSKQANVTKSHQVTRQRCWWQQKKRRQQTP